MKEKFSLQPVGSDIQAEKLKAVHAEMRDSTANFALKREAQCLWA